MLMAVAPDQAMGIGYACPCWIIEDVSLVQILKMAKLFDSTVLSCDKILFSVVAIFSWKDFISLVGNFDNFFLLSLYLFLL